LRSFFNVIVSELAEIFEARSKEEKTVSNFFKTDGKYTETILGVIMNRFIINEVKRDEINKYLNIFNTSKQ
jgi:hypothetical protein